MALLFRLNESRIKENPLIYRKKPMKSLRFLLICFLFTCSYIQQSNAAKKSCLSNIHHLIGRYSPTIKESEWAVWNKKYSDIENARHREEPSGIWGFARLQDGIHPLHTHVQEEWYFVKKGYGNIQVGDRVFKIKPGEKVYIPGNVKHAISKHPDSKEDLVFEYFFPNVQDFEKNVEYIWLK